MNVNRCILRRENCTSQCLSHRDRTDTYNLETVGTTARRDGHLEFDICLLNYYKTKHYLTTNEVKQSVTRAKMISLKNNLVSVSVVVIIIIIFVHKRNVQR